MATSPTSHSETENETASTSAFHTKLHVWDTGPIPYKTPKPSAKPKPKPEPEPVFFNPSSGKFRLTGTGACLPFVLPPDIDWEGHEDLIDQGKALALLWYDLKPAQREKRAAKIMRAAWALTSEFASVDPETRERWVSRLQVLPSAEWSISERAAWSRAEPDNLLTQKAMGLEALEDTPLGRKLRDTGGGACPRRGRLFAGIPSSKPRQPGFLVLPQDSVPFSGWALGVKLFGRPCPYTPRHGFLESRQLDTPEDAYLMLADTLKVDPLGEVILMPKLSGRYSFVATSAGIAIGKGNEGATGGQSSFVPCPVDTKKWNAFASRWMPADDQEAYVEGVEHEATSVLVQSRFGPIQPRGSATRWVPRDFTGKRVKSFYFQHDGGAFYTALEWEEAMLQAGKSQAARPDVLHFVKLPEGMTLSSHAAVHAIQNGIPIVDHGESPELGDDGCWHIKADAHDSGAVGKIPDAIRERMAQAMACELSAPSFANKHTAGESSLKKSATWAYAVCHSLAFWPGDNETLMRIQALAAVEMFRAVAACCVGEARHFFTEGPGRDTSYGSPENFEPIPQGVPEERRASTIPWRRLRQRGITVSGPQGGGGSMERGALWARLLECPFSMLLALVNRAAADFAPSWSGGFGGPGWQQSAQLCYKLGRANIAFVRNPSAGNWARVTSLMNNVAWACHSGNLLFTKFHTCSTLSTISDCPTVAFMTPDFCETFLAYPAETTKRTRHLFLDEVRHFQKTVSPTF